DTFADIGIEENGKFHTLFEKGFAKEDDFPFKGGWLKNEQSFIEKIGLPLVKAITINKITDDKNLITQLREKFDARVESMEGAAFHYVCLQKHINFFQLRSISNTVGERDKSKWEMKEAISILNTELEKIVQNFI
ncbi:MAG: futalosine hydrolase, partial [Bacteroidota bacterium]|nr:futalosine hydrolase [Bacteroidota bacterium]